MSDHDLLLRLDERMETVLTILPGIESRVSKLERFRTMLATVWSIFVFTVSIGGDYFVRKMTGKP